VTPVGGTVSVTPQSTGAPVVSPYGLLYLAPDGNGNIQLWGLSLTGTAVPTPMQLGALSVPSSTYQCGTVGAAANVLQPATTFVIVQYASSFNECNSTPTVVMLSWTDSSSTAPTQVPLSGAHMGALYQMPSGQLYGLLAIDASENFNLYPAGPSGAPSFSSPVQIATGATSVQGYYITITENPLGQLVNTVAFANIFFTGSGPNQLFRVDTTGAHSSIFTSAGSLETTCSYRCYDTTNFYFIDEVTANSVTTYNFYSTPIAGGTATLVYSVTPPSGTDYNIVVSDGTWLIIESEPTPPATGVSTLYRIAVSGPSTQTATQLLQLTGIFEEYGFDYLTDDLFVNEFSPNNTSGSYTAVVLQPGASSPATPVAGPIANARYIDLSLFSPSANALELVNLPTSVTYGIAGGAGMQSVSTSNFASGSPVTCPGCGGGGYTVPSGGTLTTSGIWGGLGVTNGITIVPATVAFASSPAVGLLVNPQTLELEVLSVPSTSVASF
jgi:hypothetical protein